MEEGGWRKAVGDGLWAIKGKTASKDFAPAKHLRLRDHVYKAHMQQGLKTRAKSQRRHLHSGWLSAATVWPHDKSSEDRKKRFLSPKDVVTLLNTMMPLFI